MIKNKIIKTIGLCTLVTGVCMGLYGCSDVVVPTQDAQEVSAQEETNNWSVTDLSYVVKKAKDKGITFDKYEEQFKDQVDEVTDNIKKQIKKAEKEKGIKEERKQALNNVSSKENDRGVSQNTDQGATVGKQRVEQETIITGSNGQVNNVLPGAEEVVVDNNVQGEEVPKKEPKLQDGEQKESTPEVKATVESPAPEIRTTVESSAPEQKSEWAGKNIGRLNDGTWMATEWETKWIIVCNVCGQEFWNGADEGHTEGHLINDGVEAKYHAEPRVIE